MLNFAVCDDDRKTADEISDRLYSYFKEKNKEINISELYDGNSLLCSSKSFDAVFLDIKMPNPDGMETARLLRKSGFDGFVIFITILEDYVYDSFELSPFDYIVKPINEERFLRTLSRLNNELESQKRTLIIQNNGEKRIIPVNEIVYCEVIDRQSFIHTKSGETISFYEKIENLESSLNRAFFKCHRSYIVNLSYITAFSNGTAHMSDGSLIPVSRLRKNDFEQALIKHMRG